MADLFIRPSKVIDKLREMNTRFAAKYPGTWPQFTVYGAGSQDYIDESSKHDTPISLYVTTGSSTGSLISNNNSSPTNVTYGIDIVMMIRTQDVNGQHADEFSTFMREFVVKALHGWAPDTTQNGFIYSSDTPVVVQGHALYIRVFNFQQEVEINREDLDDALGSWDDLDPFLQLNSTINAKAPDNNDIATSESQVNVPGA